MSGRPPEVGNGDKEALPKSESLAIFWWHGGGRWGGKGVDVGE